MVNLTVGDLISFTTNDKIAFAIVISTVELLTVLTFDGKISNFFKNKESYCFNKIILLQKFADSF